MLPTKRQDVWARATETDMLQALASLAILPSRQADDARFDKAVFFLALDGVTRHGLVMAVKAILQGKLGHGFFPSPPELRLQCDAAMRAHEAERERIWRRERLRREADEFRPVHHSPEERARVAGIMSSFRATPAEKAEQAERAEIRAKYGMTPEAIASVPDQPTTWKRVGER